MSVTPQQIQTAMDAAFDGLKQEAFAAKDQSVEFGIGFTRILSNRLVPEIVSKLNATNTDHMAATTAPAGFGATSLPAWLATLLALLGTLTGGTGFLAQIITMILTLLAGGGTSPAPVPV
jgi:hypothetical protein